MIETTTSFAIMGSGGVGGYFGARLARAGYPVTMIARGEHLAAMRRHGLSIEGPDESFTEKVRATDDPADVGPVDYVLFSVKLWDTEQAARACRPLIGPDTAVVSLQNGVDSEPMVASILGAKHVMGGVAELSAVIEAPGRIRKFSPFHLARFGEMLGERSARAVRLEQCLAAAGIDADLSDDIEAAIWKKFIMLVGMSAMTAVTRMPIGAVREDADTRAMLQEIMAEAMAVARARGISLADDLVADRLRFIDGFPYEVRASMAMDLANGRRLELPWLSGAVVRLGNELGVATPANRFVTTALKLHINGAAA
ncbi:MAG: 2-dehydropantoate 2-reductase [Gammaproteobacteria bacterium]|nr:2-dehydropantoate 2-reductase [Gammaproteobacteria bacterium]